MLPALSQVEASRSSSRAGEKLDKQLKRESHALDFRVGQASCFGCGCWAQKPSRPGAIASTAVSTTGGWTFTYSNCHNLQWQACLRSIDISFHSLFKISI